MKFWMQGIHTARQNGCVCGLVTCTDLSAQLPLPYRDERIQGFPTASISALNAQVATCKWEQEVKADIREGPFQVPPISTSGPSLTLENSLSCSLKTQTPIKTRPFHCEVSGRVGHRVTEGRDVGNSVGGNSPYTQKDINWQWFFF